MKDMTIERLRAFQDAWARGDVDELMGFMADDCEYHASVGPDPGTSYFGREAVRRGFEAMLAYDDADEAFDGELLVCGPRGVAEWGYRFIRDDGTVVEVRGCDLFHFTGDKIRRKDAFRKCADERPDRANGR